MGKYKAVMFDYDGTVVDSNQIIVDSWQYLAKNMLGHEISMDLLYSTFGKPLEDGYKVIAHATGLPETEETYKKMHYYYKSYQNKVIIAPFKPFPGMVELIKALHKEGIKLGIVTSRMLDSLESGLRADGIYECFDSLIYKEKTEVHKPNPYPAELCCKEMGVEPARAIMVGDSKYDIACGNNAGCGSIFVNWSQCFVKKDIEEYSPATYYVDKAEDILKIVLEDN